jgi:hypothetical protein
MGTVVMISLTLCFAKSLKDLIFFDARECNGTDRGVFEGLLGIVVDGIKMEFAQNVSKKDHFLV